MNYIVPFLFTLIERPFLTWILKEVAQPSNHIFPLGFGQASKASSQNGWMLRLCPSVFLPTKASARQIIVRQNPPDL